jgi:naphthoate synthase
MLLARQVGQKFAREIFFLGQEYDADRALEIGAVNKVVDHEQLESAGLVYAEQILEKSPTAIRMLKYAFNAADDGMVGQQLFAGEATRLAYGSAEAKEGRDAFLEKRKPNWSDTPWHF